MERRKFTSEFKREAVRLNKVAGVSAARLSRDLGIHMTVLRRWVKEALGDPRRLSLVRAMRSRTNWRLFSFVVRSPS
jgi:transposase-like protein